MAGSTSAVETPSPSTDCSATIIRSPQHRRSFLEAAPTPQRKASPSKTAHPTPPSITQLTAAHPALDRPSTPDRSRSLLRRPFKQSHSLPASHKAMWDWPLTPLTPALAAACLLL